MKKIFFTMALLVSAGAMSAQGNVEVISEGLRFCESTYPYNGGLLIANFGTQELNPLNNEGQGYIMFHKDGKTEVLVAADGNLSAPKGMFERRGYLYVCDVNRIMVYNLNDTAASPLTIAMPEGNLFVNDLAAEGNTLYASVTNTDRIYRIDITDPSRPGTPEEWLQVAGPNGLLMKDGQLYVASYPADGVTKDVNVVYRIADLQHPVAEKVTETTGQYDGLALASDGRSLCVTNWTPAGLSLLNPENETLSEVEIDLGNAPLIGPADITVKDGKVYIPDLPNSRVIVVDGI